MTNKDTASVPNQSKLHLMHLFSPALPIGNFAYSQGLEYAIEVQWVSDAASAQSWLNGIMTHSLACLDIPALFRLYDAIQTHDIERLNYWNAILIASRETCELRDEDIQLARTMKRLLTSLEVAGMELLDSCQPTSLLTMIALAGNYWAIDKTDLAQGFLWSWLENQVVVLNKVLPMGQTQGQRLLLKLMPIIPKLIDQAGVIVDEDVGASLPGLALSSTLHETQYSRLFRS